MKNSGKFQNSMRAVTINSEFSLPGLILRLQDQRTLGSLTFQGKGVGFGVETMKYEKFWENSKFHAGGDDKQ